MSHRTKAAIAAGVAVLAVPAGASAATKTVDMGTPLSSQKAFQKAFADVNDFFPHGTTIHVGDSIKFVPTGFHTVDIPAKGGKPLGLVAPAGSTSRRASTPPALRSGSTGSRRSASPRRSARQGSSARR